MPQRYYIKYWVQTEDFYTNDWSNQEVKLLIPKIIDNKVFEPQVSLQFLQVW